MRICDKCESRLGVHDCKVVINLVNQNNVEKNLELCTGCSAVLDSTLKNSLSRFLDLPISIGVPLDINKPKLHKPKVGRKV